MIATDIDDTLLSSDGKLLPSTIEAVQSAVARGVKVVLCSGRPFAGLRVILGQLGIRANNQYVVTYNGAIIANAEGEPISSEILSYDDYVSLTNFAASHHVPFNVLDEHSHIYTANRDIDAITVVQAAENRAGLFYRQPDEMPADFQIAKGVFAGDSDRLDAVESAVRAKYGKTHYVVRAASNFLEVMHQDVSKGNALHRLTRMLDIKPGEVMVLGDEANDIPMFNFAGVAVAMGNGSDAAKGAATFITADNDHDGWAKAVDKFVLK
jgi:Cof subfamily protein (haloacid dehalogenase superfamily)